MLQLGFCTLGDSAAVTSLTLASRIAIGLHFRPHVSTFLSYLSKDALECGALVPDVSTARINEGYISSTARDLEMFSNEAKQCGTVLLVRIWVYVVQGDKGQKECRLKCPVPS